MIEIEKKFLIENIPFSLDNYQHKDITQGYLYDNPVLRIRKSNENYSFTYKGKGLMARQEINVNIQKSDFDSLISNCKWKINKIRYIIPYEIYTIELDIFKDELDGLIMAEVEFPDIDAAENFVPPDWFGKEVTNEPNFQNINLAKNIYE